jgi:cell division protein FtsQ
MKKNIASKKYLRAVLLVLLLSICVFLLPIWNISEIMIEGNTYYTNEEIIQNTTLELGVHSLMVQKNKLIEAIENMPYIEKVDIRHIFPNKIVLTIEENEPVGYIAFSGSYLCLDNTGKVLSQTNERMLKLPEIKGVKIDKFKVGEVLEIENDDVFLEICKIIETLKTYDFIDQVDVIQAPNLSKIYLYVGGLDVIIGTSKDIEDKVKWLIEISKDYSMGVLDLTAISFGQAVLTPLN